MTASIYPLGRRSRPAVYAGVALGCLALKAAVLLLDHAPRFHNDSGSYLRDSLRLVPNWPRPLGYGVILRGLWTVVGGVDLNAVVVFQGLAGAALGVLTFALGERALRLPRGVAAAAAAVVVASPLALVVERYVLSDALTVAVVAVSIAALFVYLARPRAATAVLAGATAALPCLMRSAWVFLPLLAVGLAALWQLPGAGRDARRAAAFLGIALVSALAVYVPYSAAFSHHNLGEVDITANGSGFTGWLLWASVSSFAEPADLAGIPGAEVLLADPEALRQRNPAYQIWDFDAPPNRLRKERFGGSFVRTNRYLLRVALRVAARHPVRLAEVIGRGLLRFFLPAPGFDDYAGPLELQPRLYGEFQRLAGIDLASLAPSPPTLAPAFRLWRWSRPVFGFALLAALVAGLAAPRRRFPMLAVSAIGGAYLVVVNAAVPFVFVERYFLPVEYLGVLAAALLIVGAARWRSTEARQAPAGQSPGSE